MGCQRTMASIIERITGYKIEKDIFLGIPNKCGVYIIYCIDLENLTFNIFYIGSAKNISKRLSTLNHPISKYIKNPSISYRIDIILCENYKNIEKTLIKLFQPQLNKMHK